MFCQRADVLLLALYFVLWAIYIHVYIVALDIEATMVKLASKTSWDAKKVISVICYIDKSDFFVQEICSFCEK